MADKRVYDASGDGVVFVWHGGPYIEMFWADAYRLRGDDAENPASAFNVINVWDYSTGQAAISTREEMIARCDEWLTENRGEELGKYLEHSF
jgi:hypothetical protein